MCILSALVWISCLISDLTLSRTLAGGIANGGHGVGRGQFGGIDGGVAKMASMKRPRLQQIEVLADHRLRLVFVDGSGFTVDFIPLLADSPGLVPLRDPALFAEARLIEGEGWTVEWPSLDIQVGADTLWLDAHAQNAADENSRVFYAWRARHGLSLTEAAEALGMPAAPSAPTAAANAPSPAISL